MTSNNKLNFGESFNQEHNFHEQNYQDSLFPEITYENENIIVTHNSTGEERYFINFFKIKFLLNYKKLISIIKILLTIYKINSTNIYHQKKIINF